MSPPPTLLLFLCSLDFAALGGLLFGLHDPENIVPLLVTGKSRNIPTLFTRYLSTINHVRQWYLGDILDHSSPAYESLVFVRSRHLAAYNKVNSSIARSEAGDPDEVWMSQGTMVRVQFAFIGLILLYPRECGLTEDVEIIQQELCYYWRVIGSILGIDDGYNLCSHSFDVTVELCKKLRDELVDQINTNGARNEMPTQMARDIVKSLNTVLLFNMPGDIYIHYWCRVMRVNEDLCPRIDGFKNKLLYHCLVNITQSSWSFPRAMIQNITSERIKFSLKHRRSIYKEYCRKYSQAKYCLSDYQNNATTKCPFGAG